VVGVGVGVGVGGGAGGHDQRQERLQSTQQTSQLSQLSQQRAAAIAARQEVTTATGNGRAGMPQAQVQALLMARALHMSKEHYQAMVAAGRIDEKKLSGTEKKMVLERFVHSFTAQLSAQFGIPLGPAGGANTNAQAGANNMRVSIDKRSGRRRAAAQLQNAEDQTTKGEHAEALMTKVGEISKQLRDELASKMRSGGRTGSFDAVSQQTVIETCGSNSRFLKGYQIIGINFLLLLYRSQVGGAILADEMGLGKTCQIISYLGVIASLEQDEGPHLVVAPASLLENWQRELHRWCPKLKSVVYYGKNRAVIRKTLGDLKEKMAAGERVEEDALDGLQDEDMLAEMAMQEKLVAEAGSEGDEDDEFGDDGARSDSGGSDQDYDDRRERLNPSGGKPKAAVPPPPKWDFKARLPPAPFNVLLTSYTLFERDSMEQRKDRKFLESWLWSHIIMDEAHALKNKDSQRTSRLRRVAHVSRRRIMMTGTPLQNDLAELQNLMQFLLPHVFKTEAFGDFTEIANDEKKVADLTEQMKDMLGPFVMRRLKTEVAGQLTAKVHKTEFIDMTDKQQELYAASLAVMKSQIKSSIKTPAQEKALKGVGKGGEEEEAGLKKFMMSIGAKKVSHMFSHLRKIALHPMLVRSYFSDFDVQVIAKKALDHRLFSGNVSLKKVEEELMGYSDYALHAFCHSAGPDFEMHRLDLEHMMSSCKFRFLADLLPKLKAAGSRPLIFSQWTSVLDIIEWLMDVLQLPYVRLDGSTAVDERLATVDRFNNGSEDVFAFLLSTRAGGQGLNLTGADTVILHDVDFNPQIDRQAEDRCHRLGQTKPVTVYRLITKSTVDQNIFGMSLRKLKLDHAVLDGLTSGAGAKIKQNAQERQQMGAILRELLAGEENYDEMAEHVMKMEKEENELSRAGL